MMEITEFDAFVYNAYISFPSTPLAHVSKTKLTSVANVIMLFLLTVEIDGGEGVGGSMVESVEGEGSREVWRELIHGTFPWCACWWR